MLKEISEISAINDKVDKTHFCFQQFVHEYEVAIKRIKKELDGNQQLLSAFGDPSPSLIMVRRFMKCVFDI